MKELDFVWVLSSDMSDETTALGGRVNTVGTLIGLFTRVDAEVFRQTA